MITTKSQQSQQLGIGVKADTQINGAEPRAQK